MRPMSAPSAPAARPTPLAGRPMLRAVAAGVTLGFVALTISLGNWQARRAEEKEARQHRVDERSRAPTVDLERDRLAPDAILGRRVSVAGAPIDDRTILLDNRVHERVAGYHVYTPIRVGVDGPVVLVNRGWIGQGRDRSAAPAIRPVAPGVRIEGIASPWPGHLVELKAIDPEPPRGQRPVWQNLDAARFERATGLAPMPFVLLQTSPAADGLVRDWPAPGSGSDTNRMYSLQWYSFAALAVALFVWRASRWR